MTRTELSQIRVGTPLFVELDKGAKPARASYHSLRVVGRGRHARTYVCVLLQPGSRPLRVSIRRILGLAF